MRFHYGEAMTAIANYLPLAQAAEANGFTGFAIPDSLIYAKASAAQYSYTGDGGREFLENKPFIESFVLAASMGAATKTLELTSNVIKLPVRPPIYSAKLAASVAALTGDRFNFGVGLSVWPEDYQVMSLDYAARGRRMDECIAIVRGLCAGGYFEFQGEFYDFPPVKLNPIPAKPLPILIGGHSDAALMRAARNDGFISAGCPLEQLEMLLRKLDRFRQEARTQHKPFRIFSMEMGAVTLDSVRRHAELGVTDMVVSLRNLYAVEEDRQSLADKLDQIKRFADQIIAKLA